MPGIRFAILTGRSNRKVRSSMSMALKARLTNPTEPTSVVQEIVAGYRVLGSASIEHGSMLPASAFSPTSR